MAELFFGIHDWYKNDRTELQSGNKVRFRPDPPRMKPNVHISEVFQMACTSSPNDL